MNSDVLFYLSVWLFVVGIILVMTRRHAILVLIGIELMLNASNINWMRWAPPPSLQIDGQLATLFVIVIAVCETAVGLAIVVRVFHYFRTCSIDEISSLNEQW